ncbi:MAG: hypothetical protein J6S49_00915, partial [Erysipelotrichaceae bacterium]|nr:hypothetical protein [Erysipelotrichaceae bacterium]
LKESETMFNNTSSVITPYRLKNKTQDYIYVAEQNIISDMYGTPCYQAVAIDITDSMKLRNQMEILSNYLNDTILVLHRINGVLTYEVVVEDKVMRERMKLEPKQLEESLNNGEFCKLIKGYDPSIGHAEYTERFIPNIVGNYRRINVMMPDGEYADVLVRADVIEGNTMSEYIVMMHLIRDLNKLNVEMIDG